MFHHTQMLRLRIRAWTAFCLMLVPGQWMNVARAETNTLARVQNNVTNLTAENRLLREENRKLREELVQGEAAAQKQAQITAAANSSTTNGAVLYWVTSGSKVRHNPSCRYYKKTKGYLTPKKEGVPCKRCGG